MKHKLETLSLIAFTVLLTLSLTTGAALCKANQASAHACCQTEASHHNTANPSHCPMCTITAANSTEGISLKNLPASLYQSVSAELPAMQSHWALASIQNDLSPHAHTLAQNLLNEGLLAKHYQQLVSHLYFEIA